jgi:hypothetical protein
MASITTIQPRIEKPRAIFVRARCPSWASKSEYHSLGRMSWHGRPPINTDQQRISILNTFYVNEQVAF